MGYEVTYNYYDKLKDSFDYDRDNLKNFKKVYGKATEDYPLEKLYQAIMQQLARRDIFIVDWEIFEFVRKKVTSRITKSDLVIKNRKFSMKNVVLENMEESDFEPTHQNALLPVQTACAVAPSQPVVNHVVNQPIVNVANPVNIAPAAQKQVNIAPSRPEKIIKYMQFLPGRMMKPIGRFTIEKVYPVYRETFAPNGIGMLLETVDDAGNRVKVSDEHFVPSQANLIGDEEAKFSQTSNNFVDDSKLGWSGLMKDNIPAVR